MKTLGNVLWIIFGGLEIFLIWGIVGILCCMTLIGIPVGVQCFKFAGFVLWPFGREICWSSRTGHVLLNVIWIVLFGWHLALISAVFCLLWCITIVGIPFGMQCFKMARLSLMPFGAEVRKQ